MAKRFGVNSDNFDYIIANASGIKNGEFENVKNSIKIPKKDLMNEQDKIAEIKKYNLGLQNIKISYDVQEYINKKIIMPKDKQ